MAAVAPEQCSAGRFWWGVAAAPPCCGGRALAGVIAVYCGGLRGVVYSVVDVRLGRRSGLFETRVWRVVDGRQRAAYFIARATRRCSV